MSVPTILSQDVKVAEVFQSFYAVPDYQREYVWQPEQVEQLLTDIQSEREGVAPDAAPEYFIGSIVVCPGKNGVLDLIDGQQRMTTLFLTLCAIRQRYRELKLTESGVLNAQIAASSINELGEECFRYRLDLQYEDSRGVLVKIAKGEIDQVQRESTRSVANIVNAYETALGFLRSEFSEDGAALGRFYGYLSNRVKLIRIQTENVAKALKIFETINDRGVGLDSMDLLKNLLFMKSAAQDFDKLKVGWKSLQDTLHGAKEKPLRFLRYFIFSHYKVEGDKLREDEIYGWFTRNEEQCGYAKNPVAFVSELRRAASAYANFLAGKDADGRERVELESLNLLGGGKATQHLILLLAGSRLTGAHFAKLVAEVENLFFIYVVTRSNTRDFERNFVQWAAEVRAIKHDAELEAFLQNRIGRAKAELSTRFDDAFRLLDFDELQTYRLRYILGKLNQHLEVKAYPDSEQKRRLTNFVGRDFQIEHIHPQNASPEAEVQFGAATIPGLVGRLGNLVLVEKSINASLGNKPYSQKRDVYPGSSLLLVKAIAQRPVIGKNTAIDRAVRDLESYPVWNESAVVARQAQLLRLSREIWGLAGADTATANS